jgi:hypothetical protein
MPVSSLVRELLTRHLVTSSDSGNGGDSLVFQYFRTHRSVSTAFSDRFVLNTVSLALSSLRNPLFGAADSSRAFGAEC